MLGARVHAENVTAERAATIELGRSGAWCDAVIVGSPAVTTVRVGTLTWASRSTYSLLARATSDVVVLPEEVQAANEEAAAQSLTTRYQVRVPGSGLPWLLRRSTPTRRSFSERIAAGDRRHA